MAARRALACWIVAALVAAGCAVDFSASGADAGADADALADAASPDDAAQDAAPPDRDAEPDLPPVEDDGGWELCEPNTTTCLDAQTLGLCRREDGLWEAVTCPAGFACALGRCASVGTCMDGDGDGFGEGEGCAGADCDDAQPAVWPGARDACGDGIDANCDGIDPPCSCDPVAQDCPGGDLLMCMLGTPDAFQCATAGERGIGEPCPSASQCARGTLCVSYQQSEFTCADICDFDTGEGCQNDQACSTFLEADNGLAGICIERQRCDITAKDACDEGMKCYPLNESYGDCRPATGSNTLDQPCNPDVADQCAPGLFCAIFSGGDTACLPICDTRRGDADCANGEVCQPVPLTINAEHPEFTLEVFGFCL